VLFWNSGGGVGDKTRPNDVEFIGKVLDDLATVVTVNPKKVYATGISNGGMMSYKLANDLSDRIAAIAPVAGTMTFDKAQPKRPVPVLHLHGSADTVVPVTGAKAGLAKAVLPFKSLDTTIAAWVECNHCQKEAQTNDTPDKAKDGTKIHQKTYAPEKEGAEVILYLIEGGGHTWPGAKMAVGFLGNTTHNLSANDVIWEFFTKHELK
jgi:polyhydroxybutyrate depolymerase